MKIVKAKTIVKKWSGFLSCCCYLKLVVDFCCKKKNGWLVLFNRPRGHEKQSWSRIERLQKVREFPLFVSKF
jgi:hypothetical protein